MSCLCAAGALWLAGPAFAQEPNYTTTTSQGGSPGTSWASSIIWKLNGAGASVAAAAGNTYEATNNGTLLGSGTATTLLRNPYSTGVASIAVFPGDSIKLDTNTQIRFKALNTAGTSAQGLNFENPTNNFPGANGLPGLVLNGGCLNVGDSADAATILGTIYANPGTQSYLDPADTFSGTFAARGLIIPAQLSGSGNIALLNAENTVPQTITGTSNTYSGQWAVKAGWLLGAGDGTPDGYNSLGTNATFVVDPMWNVPATFASGAVFNPGPAVLDFGASLANCGGTLTLTNGGQLYLHGLVVLSAVTIEGTILTNGTYSYAYLANNFPNNFTGLPAATFPTGSGLLVVEHYSAVAVIAPQFLIQPLAAEVYSGVTVSLSASAIGNPLFYQWLINGAPLANGGSISGATTSTLTISNATTANVAAYSLVVSNAAGAVTSTVCPLTILLQNIEQADNAVQSNNPVAFYTLNEQGDPSTNTAAFDIAGGHTGTYGTFVQNGSPNYAVAGPRPANGLPGFSPTNWAAQFSGGANSRITLPPMNLPNSTNVTITCWINPSGAEQLSAGVVFCRGGATVAGINYFTNNSPGTINVPIGYTWNNNAATYGFNSSIVPPANQWSFVALVITPANASLFVLNTNSFLNVVNPVANTVAQPFDGNTLIGDDNADNNNGTRGFGGMIDNVAIFNTNLTVDQLVTMFTNAAGANFNFQPSVQVPPPNTNVFVGETLLLTVQASGPAIGYVWESAPIGSSSFNPIVNGGQFSGANSNVLTISNITTANALQYLCLVTNFSGSAFSLPPGVVTVMPTGPAEQVTLAVQEAGGADWNTTNQWSDLNPAWYSTAAFPGTTYEVLPDALLRTPVAQTATFPGVSLQIDGDGVYTNINTDVAGVLEGILRFKPNNATPATNIFPKLILAGGVLDGGQVSVTNVIQGIVNVISNSSIGVNSGGNSNEPYRIDAFLTGNGGLAYSDYTNHGYSSGGLIITGTTNTFTGTWTVLQGALLGSGTNSLGTNSITVQPGGALETAYNMNSPHATLALISGNNYFGFTNGIMLLHQADTFSNVFINTTALAAGTYSFAQLNSNFPSYFPSNWVAITGSTTTNGSGSITVLNNYPVITVQPVATNLYDEQNLVLTVTAFGNNITYQWAAGVTGSGVYTNLLNGGNVSGVNTATLTIVNVTNVNALDYVCVISNSTGVAQSLPATVAVTQVLGPAEAITLSVAEGIGQDWNTSGVWSDGNPASYSADYYPGSTYEVLIGALLRTPSNAPNSVFPGNYLQLDGNGVYVDINGTVPSLGTLRFKPSASPSTNFFPLLVMAGGLLDGGNASQMFIIQGKMNVISNSCIGVNSGGNGSEPFRIDAYLTGSGGLTYSDFTNSEQSTADLNITGTTNTFTGTWQVLEGALLGSGTNSLGTNSITVQPGGALETLYNINSPHATLAISNGVMFLHQADTFYNVFIDGTILGAGTYSFAQLNSNFPATFPAVWGAALGSTNTTGSGSITVLNTNPFPVTLTSQLPAQEDTVVGSTVTYSVSASGGTPPISYQWYLNGAAVAGATNSTFTTTATAGTNSVYVTVKNAAGTLTNGPSLLIGSATAPVVTLNSTNWILQGTGGTGGTPSLSIGYLVLTDNVTNEASSAFYGIPQYIGAFNAAFTYTVGPNATADGVTFCVQNSPAGPTALGALGGGLGYTGITNSAALEFVIYGTATNGPGLAFGVNGNVGIGGSISSINLTNGDPIQVQLSYNSGSGNMSVQLTDPNVPSVFATNIAVGNLPAIIGSSVAYVGFTGGDGGSTSFQQINGFTYSYTNAIALAAPTLSITTPAKGTYIISWPSSALSTLHLQSSSSVIGPWSNVTNAPVTSGGQFQVTVSPSASAQFYRLISP